MTRYQEIQERVQAELDSVIGKDQSPSYNDRHNLPYTEVNGDTDQDMVA